MKALSLRYRIGLYVKFVTGFLLTAIGTSLISYLPRYREIVSGLLFVALYILPHFYLGFRLIRRSRLKRIIVGIAVIVISTMLLIFKIWVDEGTFNNPFIMTYMHKSRRLFNYVVYFVWTTIVIWEIVFIVHVKSERDSD